MVGGLGQGSYQQKERIVPKEAICKLSHHANYLLFLWGDKEDSGDSLTGVEKKGS